jgi:hypothetical protein
MKVSYILEMEDQEVPVLITESLSRYVRRSILPKQSRNGATISETIRGSGGLFELPFSPGSWLKPGLKGTL